MASSQRSPRPPVVPAGTSQLQPLRVRHGLGHGPAAGAEPKDPPAAPAAPAAAVPSSSPPPPPRYLALEVLG